MTIHAAWQNNDNYKGVIKVGYEADFVILNLNPLVYPSIFDSIQVDATIKRNKIVFCRHGVAEKCLLRHNPAFRRLRK